MSIKLTKTTRIELDIEKELFKNECKEGKYIGIPVEFFETEHGVVYMSPKLTHVIEWTVIEKIDGFVNLINTAQKFTVDGESYSLNAGLFSTTVREEDL